MAEKEWWADISRQRIAPGQISFNDLCWDGDADIKPDISDTPRKARNINPHVFRSFTRWTLGERVYNGFEIKKNFYTLAKEKMLTNVTPQLF